MGFRRTAASSGASSGPGSVPAEDLRFASTAVLEQVAAECSEMPEQEVVPAEGTASGGNGSSTPWASSSDPESKADAEASQASVAPDTVAAGEAAGGVGEEEPEAPSSQVPEVVETDVEEHEDDEDGDGEVDPAARPAPAGSPAPIPEVVETDVEEHEGDEKEAPPSDPFSMPESEPVHPPPAAAAPPGEGTLSPPPPRRRGLHQPAVRTAPAARKRPTPAPATPSAAHAALTEASLEGDAPAEEEGDGPTPSAAPPVRRKLDSKPRKLGQPSGAAKSKPTPQRKPGEKPRAQKSRGEGAASEPKKKKAKKDPDAPKGALSAYMLWSMQERKSDAYAGMKVPEAGKALGATWKTMDEAARAPWVEASKEDHARHAREMASYVPSPEYARAQAAAPKARSGSSGGAKKAATPASRGVGKGAAASAASKKSAAGRKRKALARGDADSSDDEATPSKLAFSPPPPLADAPPPMLEDVRLLPKERAPMRALKLKVGARVAWVPQCYNEFAKRYEAELDALQLVIDVPADLLESPADGTAHCAEIVAIHPAETEGWELLTLRGVPFGGGSGASEGAEYCLPYVPRRLCDVDQHVCALKEYLASRERALSASASPHVRVPFAAPDSEGEEELWEGRVWSRKPFDALNYPDSLYRCLNCVWYVASPREHEGAAIEPLWIFDQEQTDNQVSPWEARSYDGSLSEENGRASAEAAIAARISWISSNYRFEVPEAIVQALDDTTINEVLEMKTQRALKQSLQGYSGRPKMQDLNSLRLWALKIKVDAAPFRLDSQSQGKAAAKQARQDDSVKLIVDSQRQQVAITRFDPTAAAPADAYLPPRDPTVFYRLYEHCKHAGAIDAIVSTPFGVGEPLLGLLERLGAEAFRIIWSREMTTFCLLTGLSPDLSRIITRTGTTVDKIVRAGVEALQYDRTTDTPVSRLVKLLLDHGVLTWDQTGTKINLGPVIKALRNTGGAGSKVEPHALLLLSAQLACKARMIDFKTDKIQFEACVQGKFFKSRLLFACGYTEDDLPPGVAKLTYVPGYHELISIANSQFHTDLVLMLERDEQRFRSTGKALPFKLIFLDPAGGEESVPYNVTDATRMGTPQRYSRALKESTLYTALQGLAEIVLGEGYNLCDAMHICTFTNCFKLSRRQSRSYDWTILIGADFVVKYEWGGETIVVDKREIMRTLLQTAGEPKDDGSPDFVDDAATS